MQIRAFAIPTSLGLQNLNMKGKNEKDCGRSSKMMPLCKWPIIQAIEEKLLHHVAMVAKFLDDDKLKASCKK